MALTREQVRRIDQLAVERYGIPGLILMENAGRGATEIIREVYGPKSAAFIVCGGGNNGGDGCVIARHLHNAGWNVRLLMTGDPSKHTPDTRTNFCIVQAMEIPLVVALDRDKQNASVPELNDEHVIVDALLGTGFTGRVRSPTAELILALNASRKRAMVAIDVPSGLDCDTGLPSNATIAADLTITFVAEKVGFATVSAARFTGEVRVVDIGAPRELLAGVATPLT